MTGPANPLSELRDAASGPLEPYLRMMAAVRGLDHIPAEGPVLLVGNHSGGTVIVDTFVFAQAFYDRFGPGRVFYQLAHDLVFKVVGARALVQRYGTVPASPENMAQALKRDAALLVYPGGDHETFRPSWESDQTRLSNERDLPVVG
jgi:1-acyl-sn-glycerol-3-phosphate acyltransferase